MPFRFGFPVQVSRFSVLLDSHSSVLPEKKKQQQQEEGEQNLSNFYVLSQIHNILFSWQCRQNNGKRIGEGAWKCYPFRRNVISLKILHQFEKHRKQSSTGTDPFDIQAP